MKALLQRTGLVVLTIAVATLAACSSQEPPEQAPTAPEQEPAPAQQPQPAEEPPAAGDFEAAEPGSDVLSIQEINETGVLKTIYFDYDQSGIRPDQRATLQANAQFLRNNSNFRLVIAGHCDERGTRDYNMALGERRASATMQYLVSLGVPRDRVDIISYGEETPAATGNNESAWAQNRRAQFQAVEGNDR